MSVAEHDVAFDRPGQPSARSVEGVIAAVAPDLLAYLLRRATSHDDAADVLADSIAVAWRRAGDMPADDTEARMWLFGVARNTLATHRRGAARRDALLGRLRDELRASPLIADAGGAAAGDETARSRVQDAIATLPPIDREIIRLVHWEGFPLEEVARIIGKRPTTVRSRYSRARRRLRLFLAEDVDE